MKWFAKVNIFLLLFISLTSAWSVAVAKETIDQLKYRELFYHFYNKDFFSAISLLTARQDLGVLRENDDGLSMLVGSLYGEYGLYDESDELLSAIASNAKSQDMRSLAWFYLGKSYVEREQFATADKLFLKVNKLKRQNLKDELNYLRLDIGLEAGRINKGEKLYDEIHKRSLWKKYAQFNLGASMIKAGNNKQGIKLISRIGAQDMEGEELLSLRDKANVVLGYLFLREGDFEKAREYFERVRLDSALSRKAMLGLGWAFSRENRYELAMAPWKKLSEEDAHDLVVQEAMLAIGYAYSQVGANAQALSQYERSLKVYKEIQKSLSNSVFEVENGRVTSLLFSDNKFDDAAITNRLIDVLRKEEGHIILDMLKEKSFQKAFSEYRELKSLQSRLQTWRRQLKAYNHQKPDSKLPRARAKSDLNAVSLNNRINKMDLNLGMLLSNYELRLQKKMVDYLETQQRYVAYYLSQTRFAIAQLIDASSQESRQ